MLYGHISCFANAHFNKNITLSDYIWKFIGFMLLPCIFMFLFFGLVIIFPFRKDIA